jgi:hypothetical protein
VALLLLVFVVGSVLIFTLGPAAPLQQVPPGEPLLDVTRGYTPEHAHRVLTGYGEEGRRMYTRFLLLDFVFAGLFAVAIGSLLFYTARRLGAPPRWAWVPASLPLVAGALDWIENALLLLMTIDHPDRTEAIAPITSPVTTVKLPLMNFSFMLAGLALLALLGLWLYSITLRRRRVGA